MEIQTLANLLVAAGTIVLAGITAVLAWQSAKNIRYTKLVALTPIYELLAREKTEVLSGLVEKYGPLEGSWLDIEGEDRERVQRIYSIEAALQFLRSEMWTQAVPKKGFEAQYRAMLDQIGGGAEQSAPRLPDVPATDGGD